MSKMIELECQCGKVLHVPRWRTGQTGRCTHCEQSVKIPPVLSRRQAPESVEFDEENENVQLSESVEFDEENANVQPGEILPCPYCGQEISDSSDYCSNCKNAVREELAQKESEPLATETKSRSKAPVFALIVAVIIAGAAFACYRYQAVILPIWAKWKGEIKPEEKADRPPKPDPDQTARTSAQEYQKWRESWENFRQKEFPALVKNRNFKQAHNKMENLRSLQKKFSQHAKENLYLIETLRDLKNLEKLFALSQQKLDEYKKDKKTIQIKLFNGKSRRGKIVKTSDKDKNFVLRRSGKNETIPFKNLSSTKLEQLLAVKFSREGKVLCYLGVLFYYEGNGKKCRKYLGKAVGAKKKYKPAKIMYRHFKKTGKLR